MSHLIQITARSAEAAKDRLAQASILHAGALVALAGAFNPRACRDSQRQCLGSLVKASRSLVADFKTVGEGDGANLHCEHLFWELHWPSSAIFGLHEKDPDEVWMLERDELIGKTLANLSEACSGSHLELKQMARAVREHGDLAEELCAKDVELTGKGPPDWDPESGAYRFDRLAVLLYDAAEQLEMRADKLCEDESF